MALNIPLLKRLRTRFLRMRHPEHFNMQVLAAPTDCGTAMCIAGHVLDLQGYKVRFDDDGCAHGCCKPTPIYHAPNSKRQIRGKAALPVAAKEMGTYYRSGSPSMRLFHDFDIKTPKQAAERIQQIIETGKV